MVPKFQKVEAWETEAKKYYFSIMAPIFWNRLPSQAKLLSLIMAFWEIVKIEVFLQGMIMCHLKLNFISVLELCITCVLLKLLHL